MFTVTGKVTNSKTLSTSKFKGFLIEDGYQVATVLRLDSNRYWDWNVKWFSDRAKVRFETYCNTLSIGETLATLVTKK